MYVSFSKDVTHLSEDLAYTTHLTEVLACDDGSKAVQCRLEEHALLSRNCKILRPIHNIEAKRTIIKTNEFLTIFRYTDITFPLSETFENILETDYVRD